jgi:hypothetical protein
VPPLATWDSSRSLTWRAAPGVEAGQRLVEDQELRFVDQRAGQRQLLLHAAREPSVSSCACWPGPATRAVARARLGRLALDAPQAGHEFQVLGRLELPVQHGIVRQVGHAALGLRRVARQVDAEHLDAAGIRRQQAGHHAQGGRLAGAVRSQQRIELATRATVRSRPSTAGRPKFCVAA